MCIPNEKGIIISLSTISVNKTYNLKRLCLDYDDLH